MLVEYALALARRGLWVFPLRPRDKVPLTSDGFKSATTDSGLIEQWWHAVPAANIGIATGERSDIFVLDVDGADAEAELRKLETEHGALPPTVEVITGRGRHLWWNYPDKPVRNSAGKVGAGLDIRGEGGYVLAPPSVHPSGRAYCWSVDSADAIAGAPSWLVTKANGGNGNSGNGTAAPASTLRGLLYDGVSEGARNDSAARLAGHLLRRHVDPLVTLEMLLAWNATRCRPPLDEDEVVAIVDSIAARELKRRGCT
jgi:hypothetical protein